VIEVQSKLSALLDTLATDRQQQERQRAMIDEAITELAPVVGVKAACAAVGRPRASHYRQHRQSAAPPRAVIEPRPQPRALSAAERAAVLEVLHEERFVDLSPGEVYAILLDEGRYLCSEATMYRLLRQMHGEVRERRRQATHPARVKPELVAHGPNQCWSWDITKLAGPAKWTYYYLYSIIDIYSGPTPQPDARSPSAASPPPSRPGRPAVPPTAWPAPPTHPCRAGRARR
jgi:hypothetical protein